MTKQICEHCNGTGKIEKTHGVFIKCLDCNGTGVQLFRNTIIVDRFPICDICYEETGKQIDAEYDAKLSAKFGGVWANVCPLHFFRCGLGLGVGKGQRMILRKTDQDINDKHARDRAELLEIEE